MIRVCLVNADSGSRAPSLRQLIEQTGARIVTECTFSTIRTETPRSGEHDVVVIDSGACPSGKDLVALTPPDLPVVLVARRDDIEKFEYVADQIVVVFTPESPSEVSLMMALVTAMHAQRHLLEIQARGEATERRLGDRINIERAKGILMQRLRITESEAYRRLRLLSRRLRKPIRELADLVLEIPAQLSLGAQSGQERMPDIMDTLRDL